MRFGAAATITSAVCLLLPFAGCGSSSTPQGATTLPVKGKITYRGQPLTKGSIAFEPDGAGKGAFGEIQPDGTFVMTTYKKDDGAVIGTHRVKVTTSGKTVPAKYSSLATSKLEVEVSEDKTDYSIELK
jgi:hypothetical protein